MTRSWILLLSLLGTIAVGADPTVIAGASLHERLGARLPDGLTLFDESGHATTLGALRQGRPLILVPAYYHCPMLCGLVITGLAQGLVRLGWPPGERYQVATISFDPTDTWQDAGRAGAAARREFSHGGCSMQAWPFLTASPAEIKELLQAIGEQVTRDPHTGVFSHPAVIMAVTPDGRISSYLTGLEFPTRDLRLALLTAGAGSTATIGDRLLLYCYHYDPASHRYGLLVTHGLQIAVLMATGLLGLLVVASVLCHRRRNSQVVAANLQRTGREP